MSRVMRKPTFCICENKDTDQLHGNREADQRLCFRYIDSMIPLLSKSEISSLSSFSQVTRTTLKSGQSSNFRQIGPTAQELAALD